MSNNETPREQESMTYEEAVREGFEQMAIDADGKKVDPRKAAGSQNEGELYTGKCKFFKVHEGYGFLSPDDGTGDVFVHQSVVKKPGFRSLEKNEAVEYRFNFSDQGREATVVTGPDGADCKGNRPRSTRCFNCGEHGHYAKDCTSPPLPKRCHFCKSEDHLVAACEEKKKARANQVKIAAKGTRPKGDDDEPEEKSEESSEGQTTVQNDS
ncbi:protein lin-28 homolog isoform X2 [Anneissia japonica]|nr:protein lin-28 homolog isoform X2 [Anneissia japonica]